MTKLCLAAKLLLAAAKTVSSLDQSIIPGIVSKGAGPPFVFTATSLQGRRGLFNAAARTGQQPSLKRINLLLGYGYGFKIDARRASRLRLHVRLS